MNQAINTFSLKNKNSGILSVISVFILLITISSYIFYQILPKNNDSFMYFTNNKQKIYILESIENESFLNKNNLSEFTYEKQLYLFKKRLEKSGYIVKTIDENSIPTLGRNDILIALDTYCITKKTLKEIKKFINKGGNFIFNYHFGYLLKNKFVKGYSIEQLTNLHYLNESLTKENIHFYVNKVLSPFNKSKNVYRKDIVLYTNDTIPLFESKQTPDAILTNWEISSTPLLNNKMLKTNQAGIMWHGFSGKGKWFYFSYPIYVFLDMQENDFKSLFNNIFNYINNKFTIAKYPFLDSKNAVFISEDTEFKYENMIHFSKLSNEMKIPVTLFCVAKLAEKNKKITQEAAQMKFIEIGSHSYSHTKILGQPKEKVIKEIAGSKEILEKITGKKIYGFRPPREEIDKTMENIIRKSGYVYVMEKNKPYLLPKEEYKGLITIPRHGTDDYLYLIRLDWDKQQILDKIIQETDMLSSINALYTLSVHTHLLSYKNNLSVLRKYYSYLKKHPEIKPLNGIEIAKRAAWNKNIIVTKQDLNNKTFLYINNKNDADIKNFTLRIYWPNSKNITITPEISSVKIKILKENTNGKYTDIQIHQLRPKSTISLILESND